MKRLPTISIVTPTLNSDIKLFEKVFKALKSQTYPKKLLEHIVLDAGSVNGTIELARKNGCKVIVRPDLKVQEQVRESLGIKMAKGDLVLVLQSDNVPTSKEWLRQLVQPFLDDPKVFCTLSAYNDYEKDMSFTTRYGAFFGSADPTLYFLKKSDKLPILQKKFDKGKIITETKGYWIVEFTNETLPTMGDNGSLFSRKVMNLVNKDPKSYVHPDAFAELIRKGYVRYGLVKNSVIHVITPNVFTYLTRRRHVKETFYDGNRGKRKYLVFDWRSSVDRQNLLRFIFFSLTFVYPFYQSIKGYTKIKDKAWFLHPLLCLLMTFQYGKSEILWLIKKRLK